MPFRVNEKPERGTAATTNRDFPPDWLVTGAVRKILRLKHSHFTSQRGHRIEIGPLDTLIGSMKDGPQYRPGSERPQGVGC